MNDLLEQQQHRRDFTTSLGGVMDVGLWFYLLVVLGFLFAIAMVNPWFRDGVFTIVNRSLDGLVDLLTPLVRRAVDRVKPIIAKHLGKHDLRERTLVFLLKLGSLPIALVALLRHLCVDPKPTSESARRVFKEWLFDPNRVAPPSDRSASGAKSERPGSDAASERSPLGAESATPADGSDFEI